MLIHRKPITDQDGKDNVGAAQRLRLKPFTMAIWVVLEEPIDVTDPILSFPNVIATPHIAGITTTAMADIARGAAENIVRL
ncbi:hypothetical protein ACCT27_35165 [Rhizobium johnstonii]|uniref:hypothetical protein n=1 Tax=Rhizobium johnstonii TaxID=3019933 RepID=UPI003F95190B